MAALLTTIIIATLTGLLALLAGLRTRDWSLAVRSLGIATLSVASYFLGTTQLAVEGVLAVIDWIQVTVWTPIMTNAAIAGGAGVSLLILGRYLPSGGTQVRSPAVPPAAKKASLTKPAARVQPSSSSSADDEIEALLRSRGIS